MKERNVEPERHREKVEGNKESLLARDTSTYIVSAVLDAAHVSLDRISEVIATAWSTLVLR